MASSMIHFVIANRIMEQIDVKNKQRFILGSLVPDACSHEDGSYDTCHFWGQSSDGLLKGINWLLFKEKYSSKLQDDSIYLGYFCHLIEDAVWFYDIVDKYVRKYPRNIRGEYYAKGYRDYGRLNYILTRKYKLDVPSLVSYDIPFEEVPAKYIMPHLEDFLKFFSTEKCDEEEFELYNLDIIEKYIEKCMQLCVNEIALIQEGKIGFNPEYYYVNV